MHPLIATIYALFGGLFGFAFCFLFEKLPEKWLLDYGEECDEARKKGARLSKKDRILSIVTLALSFFALGLINGFCFESVIFALCFVILFGVAISDAKYQIIPDQFCIAIAILALVRVAVSFALSKNAWDIWNSLIGLALGAFPLLLIGLIVNLICRRDAFGMGDTKLLCAIGMLICWKSMIGAYLCFFAIAAIHFAIQILQGKLKKGEYRPLGPYIAIGTALVVIFNSYVINAINWYCSIV